jgi:cytochrome c oxidase assembly factor 2
MPPHLHPRSRMTSSLFATTVAASFLVVGLPHLLPCPAPRVAYADAAGPDGNRRRARRRSPQDTAQVKDGIAQFDDAVDPGSKSTTLAGAGSENERKEASTVTTNSTAPRGKRECPVPKPGGVIGELMGFKKEEKTSSGKEGGVDKVTIHVDR